MLALESYKHKKGSNEDTKMWTGIAQYMKNCQQIRVKQSLSRRACRERCDLLLPKYKEKERE